MANYQVQAGTVFENFETLGDWTITGGTAEISTAIKKEGTGSLKLTSGVGTNCIATKTISSDMSRAGVISFDIYIEDTTTVSSLQMIVSSSATFTSFFSRTINGTSLINGWNTLVIGKEVWTNNSSDSWENTMVRLRVRVNAVASTTSIVYYDNMLISRYNRPKVVWIIDDGFISAYTEGYTYMKRYGMRGTCAIVSTFIDSSASYMTTAQIQEMHTAGWAMVNHTANHFNLSTLSNVSQIKDQIVLCTEYLKSLNFTRNNEHYFFVYPNGGYNDTVLATLAVTNMVAARTIITEANLSQSTPINNPYLLVTRNLGFTTTLDVAKANVDIAVKNGATLIIEAHQFVTPATTDTQFPVADFQALVDYIQHYVDGNVLDVVTFPEWYYGLQTQRKIA